MTKLYWCGVVVVLAATVARAETGPAADAVERGRYLAVAADCGACHTGPGGEEFAGGLPMPTPLGRIYSTNITPDRQTGIGAYSIEDFSRAVREGVAKDGHYLYPAMPFPAFAKIDDADIQSLYAYFQHGVAPVKQANRPSDIPFPLSFRFPLFFWDMFVRRGPFQPNPSEDAQWNRGAYLVEGPGHCAICHSPRALTLHTKALTAREGPDFLAGCRYRWLVCQEPARRQGRPRSVERSRYRYLPQNRQYRHAPPHSATWPKWCSTAPNI